jgi:integrase
MSKFKLLLLNAYDNAYDLATKKSYSEPKIYDAGGDLSKRWYVYYSFRNPETDKLERQVPIYNKVNFFETLKERKAAIKILREAVSAILKNGYNPFNDEKRVEEAELMNVSQAVNYVLGIKKNSISSSSFQDLRIRLRHFEKWLLEKGFSNRYITAVNKKTVMAYLNDVLAATSTRNRNNTRSNLSMFFKTLEENEIIPENFIPRIKVEKTTPERNKTFNISQEEEIFRLAQYDKVMLLFIKFISYNHLRPIEVVRLKVKNINIRERQLYVKTKTKNYKIKIIPEILLKEIPDLRLYNPESWLFTPTGFGQEWDAGEVSRRNNFGKRFLEIKKELGLGKDYGLYSFRHTFITKLYRELVKDSTPFEAKSKLMLITGHTSMGALEKYLRDIDAHLPDDYSNLIRGK